MKTDKPWQICEVQYVVDHHKTMTYAQMGVCLERSYNSIQGMIEQLGIRKMTFRPRKKNRHRFSGGVRDWLLGAVAE